jgi:acyl-ACP dehydrogenase
MTDAAGLSVEEYRALLGKEAVLCIGASEESSGSDLQIVETEVRSARDGFEVCGV